MDTIFIIAIATIFATNYTLTAIAYILVKRDAKRRGY